MIVTKEYGSSASYRMQMYSTTGTIEFVTDNTWSNQITGATVLANHKWHQVVGEWANDSLKIYVDGKFDASGLRSGALSYTTDPLNIGYASNTGNPFSGKIDEVKIYNYELTPDSILAHFNNVMGIPTLSSPTNGATNQSISASLSWETVSGATSYGLQVSSNANFSSTVDYQSGLTNTSAQMNNLLNGTTYYWQANAGNGISSGSWSTAWKFTTIPPIPGAPVLSSPTNGTVNQPLSSTLSWSSVNGAASYTVQVSTGLSFLTTVVSATGISGTTSAISGLSAGMVYYWQVSASNIAGTGGWSSTWYFITVPPPPAAPVLSAPSNNSANMPTSLTLSWNSSTGASSYSVQVSTDSSFTTQLVNWNGLTALNQALIGIANNTIFYWHVSAAGTYGTSAWSNAWRFGTLPATPSAPMLSTPGNGETGQATSLTLSWTSVSGTVASYTVQVSTGSTFTSTVFAQTGTGLTAAVAGLTYGGQTYYWRANAANVAGTAWSGTWNFVTLAAPATPALVSPTNNAMFANGQQVTVSWSGSASTVFYTLQVSTSSGFSSQTLSQSVLASSYQITPARGILNYWRVSATNNAGTSAWSNGWVLTPSVATAVSSSPSAMHEFSMQRSTVCYSLPRAEQVQISAYDVLGRMAMNIDTRQPEGSYSIDLKGSALAAGQYIVHFRAGTFEREAVLLLTR